MEIGKKFTREANAETSTTVDLFVDRSTKELKFLDYYKKEIILAEKAIYKVVSGRFTQEDFTYVEGPLVIGETYYISVYNGGDDFLNVGADSNESGITFVATGTTPDSWDNGSTLVDVEASIGNLTIFENTLGDISTNWSEGYPYIISNELFTDNKTWVTPDVKSGVVALARGSSSYYLVMATDTDSLKTGFSFEIRVYN